MVSLLCTYHALRGRRRYQQPSCPASTRQPRRSSLAHEERRTNKSLWKPHTLRWPLLMSWTAMTLSFIALLEFFSQKSRIHGGIAFTETHFSTSTSFGYLFLPTMIALLYSILWSWIDLDTKRLEPWFQLSEPGGAKAADSLLLCYPFVFVLEAPLMALRRRQVP